MEKYEKLDGSYKRLNTVNKMMDHKNDVAYANEVKEKKYASSAPHCPKCKSTDIQVLDNKKKAFSLGKAVGGAILTPGSIGAIAGFAGKPGNKYQALCMHCGKSFDIKL
ncbi:hypothetical protein ACVQ8P_08135 [Dellaglioa sp. BT-FLS60]